MSGETERSASDMSTSLPGGRADTRCLTVSMFAVGADRPASEPSCRSGFGRGLRSLDPLCEAVPIALRSSPMFSDLSSHLLSTICMAISVGSRMEKKFFMNPIFEKSIK
ncbi:hypothetical protein [Paraburkholderia sp. MM5384-R2]|uniref:hypothetical protein n=1 Tax=Paraburkholderia sp. MM5384-R2 TaxID=2723097 RepID=UPI00161DD2A2|nr:hypothetical protein [Paraburkholderia sp. MM5384-R2]MBB5499334.1 hypothetical protein [Paraburkholderia sp. MM5384-R2]